MLMMQQPEGFHLGIGLEKTKTLFEDRGGIQVETDALEGIYQVTLPGTKEYLEDVLFI